MLKVKPLVSRGAALLTQDSAMNHHASERGQLHGRTEMVWESLAPLRTTHTIYLVGLHPWSGVGAWPGFHGTRCPFYRGKGFPLQSCQVLTTTLEMSHVFLLRGQHRERSFYKMGFPKLKKVLENDHIPLSW